MRQGKEEEFDLEKKQKPRKQRISFQQSEAVGRKAVIILFVITVGLSLFFWLKTSLPEIWQDIFTPYKMTIEKGGE